MAMDRAKVRVAAVAVIFIDVEGASSDGGETMAEYTAAGSLGIWMVGRDRAADLRDQLTAMLGEQDSEVLLDGPALETLRTLSVGVQVEREDNPE